MGDVRIGTSRWTDKTLLRSGWYPDEVAGDAEKRLRFYAARFPLVDQRYLKTPPLQFESNRSADHTGADNGHRPIRFIRHVLSTARQSRLPPET